MNLRQLALICIGICGAVAVHAAERFPQRKVSMAGEITIEYSEGDEAYASALAARLPLEAITTGSRDCLPLSIADLSQRRERTLGLIARHLGLPAPASPMMETYDAFVAAFASLEELKPLREIRRFALWRKPELEARLQAGQQLPGFVRAEDGGIEFSLGASFELSEGEPVTGAVARMREQWAQATWPIRIGENPGMAPDAEIAERVAAARENLAQIDAMQSTEIQRMAVVMVLHETVESTLVATFLRSPDRRWFCEGVANYVAFQVLVDMLGVDAARGYYDVDAEISRHAALRPRVDLARWRVLEDPKSRELPADVNAASYAFATRAVSAAFGAHEGLLQRVLTKVRKTPLDQASIVTVHAAYRSETGRDLFEYLH
jgi:hypothetical protein